MKEYELKTYDELEVYEESFIGTLALVGKIILLSPIILLGVGAISSIVYMSLESKQYEKDVKKYLSNVTKSKVKNIKPYLKAGQKCLEDFISNNKNKFLSLFYKPKETKVDLDIGYNAFQFVKDKMIFVGHFGSGLVNKKDIKDQLKELNNINKDISISYIDVTELPGDDNGGSWSLYIDAGICQKGPEDFSEEDYKNNKKCLEKEMYKAEKSGYIEAYLVLVIPTEVLIDKYMDKNIKESYEWILKDYSK